MLSEQRKMLVVDDDEGIREFIQMIMMSEGWEVLEGRTGVDAVEMAESEQPDLILLDLMMPVMDGFEAFTQLRKNFLTKHIPVIMLTAINQPDDATPHRKYADEECYDENLIQLKLGVAKPEGFLDKPVNPRYLLDTILGVVG